MNLDNMRNALQKLEEAGLLVENEDATSLQNYIANATRICQDMLAREERGLLMNIFKREGKL